MKRSLVFLFLAVASIALAQERHVVDGVTVECSDGVCRIVEPEEAGAPSASHLPAGETPRLAQGYMGVDDFLAFLHGESSSAMFAGKALWLVAILAFLGGLAMNLTPCVLPMIPVNLMIIGRSAVRGAWYGAGIAVAYGVLGVLAAVGGLAFGEIQSSPWFNGFVAVVFFLLALSLFGVFPIDFSRFRRAGAIPGSGAGSCFVAFVMGALSALLAGACVAPVLISVLLVTAGLFGKGESWALLLPFVTGVGMALPWSFAGAGLRILPKPGAWMVRVNHVFGLVVLAFAVWYGHLALPDFSMGSSSDEDFQEARVVNVAPDGFEAALAQAKRPVLVDCWASWCKNCTAMENGTLKDARVRAELADYTVIRLRAEDIRALRALPGFGEVRGLPAFVVYPKLPQ